MVEEPNREAGPTTTGALIHIPTHEECGRLQPIVDFRK